MPHVTEEDTKENEEPEPDSPNCSQFINKKTMQNKINLIVRCS